MILFRTHVGEHIPGDPALSPALTNGREIAGPYNHEWVKGLTLSDTFVEFMEDAYRARGNRSARPLNPRSVGRFPRSPVKSDLTYPINSSLDFIYSASMSISFSPVEASSKLSAPNLTSILM